MNRPLPGAAPKLGAARVSATWVITTVVLSLAAIAFGFISHGDMATERERADTAEAAQSDAVALMGEQAGLKQEVSKLLGFYDRETADPVSKLTVAQAAMDELKSVFKDLGEVDQDFEAILPKVIASYNQRVQRVAGLETEVQGLQGQLTSARQTTTQVQSDKDSVIADLRKQIADTEQNAAQRESDLEKRVATLTNQVSERDQRVRQLDTQMQDDQRKHQRELRGLQGRVSELVHTTRFAREPFSQYPDGKVIETSGALNIGWIDLGANQRLTRGTRFTVMASTPGSERAKAMAEVVRVDANRAEVRFYEIRDRFDPVVRGDVLINPLYDPSGGRNAILAGRFSGAFDENGLGLLLERMGIKVQAQLDSTTHFLILGSELWNDPETNEPLEEPLSPTQLPIYKNAEAQGVQIIPLQEVRQFFRAGAGTTQG